MDTLRPPFAPDASLRRIIPGEAELLPRSDLWKKHGSAYWKKGAPLVYKTGMILKNCNPA